MLRLLSMLLCLGALETAIPQRGAKEPATLLLPLQDVFQNGQQIFVGRISVGTPAQEMDVGVDFPGLTVVNSVRCADPYCTSHRQYDASASSTYEEVGTAFDVPGLNASGVLSRDALGIAGATVLGQTFGEATAVWNSWTLDAPNDGVLGLGFSQNIPSILDGMLEQGVVARPVAGLWLGRDGVGGEMSIGGLNEARYSGELTWMPIVDDMVLADSISIAGISLCADTCRVSAVSLSPYFFMPMEVAKSVNDALGGKDIGQPGVAELDCDTLDDLPAWTMEIAGLTLELSPREYTFVIPLGDGGQMCISGFVGQPVWPVEFTVGTMFNQRFYMAADKESLLFGLAESA